MKALKKKCFVLVWYLTKLALGGRIVHCTNKIRLKYICIIEKNKK